MKKYKALYQAMYDDLKDSEMMIDYAWEIRDEDSKDTDVADTIAKYAKQRLDHFQEFHKIFQTHAMKETDVTKETVSQCMWDLAHEHMQEWYGKIEEKIKKY